MKKICLLLLFITSMNMTQAQISNDSLEYRIRPDSLKEGELYLSIQNFNYFRNYEYFNKIQDGYTLFGTQLEPRLLYYAHPRLAISAGVHVRKDFGGQGIYRTYPLFTIKYQKENTSLLMGALEGNIHHRMIEPLYDFEWKITEPIEYGTQFVVNSRALFLDAFINWKRMIYKPSFEQEQILGGLSTEIHLLQKSKINLSIPLQATVFHQGGQIDVVNVPLQTTVNSALGIKLKLPFQGFLRAFRAENYYVTYKELSSSGAQPFSDGNGWYLNGGVDTNYGSLMATYWNADAYSSTTGMPIYQSVSQQINHPGYTEKNRRLFILRYSFQKMLLPNLYLDLRLEPLIDLNTPPSSRKVELSNSFFLQYKRQLRLYRTKK